MTQLRTDKKVTVIGNGETVSADFEMPRWATFCTAYFPAMDDGDIGLEMSIDGGSNHAPLLKPDGSADAILCASGADPSAIDISDYVRGLPDEETHDVLVRFTCAAQSSGAVDVIVFFKE